MFRSTGEVDILRKGELFMEIRIMPLFSLDSRDDTTVEKRLASVEKVYNSYGFRVVFWPYRTKNSKNTIPLKDLIGPHLGEAMDLWRGAARLYGAQISYILPIVFAEFESEAIAGNTWDIGQGPKHGLIGTIITGDPVTKPMCTINTRICTQLTTAHEIGHAAGLEDQYEDKNRLMFGIGTTRAGYRLKPDEVLKVGASSFAY